MSQESQEPGQRDDDGLNDAWLQTEMHDLFLARETNTPALSQAALDDAIQTLKAGEPLSLPQAFDLLQQAQLGDMRIFGQIPVRATASPFIPSLGSAYIVCRRLCREDQTSASLDAQQQQEAISVTFQSVLNSEVWWSKDVPGLGIAARPMGRNIRTWKKSKDKDAKADTGIERETHGYRGRLYTLVAKKSDPAESKLRPTQPATMTQPKKETQLPAAAQPLAPLSRETGAVDSARHMGFVAQPTEAAAVASAFAPVQKEVVVGPIPATQEQPSSPISPSQGPPGSPTRSGSPTRGSKRPRATTGAQLGPNERCIAVGDIGIVQVWRPRSATESPRGKMLPVTFSSQPASPAPAGEHGAVPHGFGHFPPGAPPTGVSLIPQSAILYHHQSGTSSSMHVDAPADGTQPRRVPPESAGSTASHMGPSYETNDYVLNGTLRVRGDIYAEGRIFGKFVTPPMAAE